MKAMDARQLWWNDPEDCTCAAPDEDYPCDHAFTGYWDNLFTFEWNNVTYITDATIAIRGDLVDGLDIDPAVQMADSGRDYLTDFLALPPMEVLPARRFKLSRIDPIEACGLRIRPLTGLSVDGGEDKVHAICDPSRGWGVVGLIAGLSATSIYESREVAS